MQLQSELALHVYRQVFLGIDKPLGYTLERDAGHARRDIAIPDDIDWYVRHNDDRLPDWFMPELVEEVVAKGIPGLSLASCQALTQEGFRNLSRLSGLRVLDLFNTNADDAVLSELGSLKGIVSLNLAGTPVTDAVAEAVARFENLEKLHLGWTGITDAMLDDIRRLPELKVLDLSHTDVTDAGMSRIAAFPRLETLVLRETEIGDEGVRALLPLKSKLRRLYLEHTKVTSASVPALKQFTELRTLMLRATHVPRDLDSDIRAALPRLGGDDTGPDGVQEGLIR